MANSYFSNFREDLKRIRSGKLPENSHSRFPFVPKDPSTRFQRSTSFSDFSERYLADVEKSRQQKEEAALKEVLNRKNF